ncbi:hypothetical protein scyTo_0005558 [Scyliorhinus torazame]|uniref:Uncharacterized protein n=1 Tax=Scyliorhinus torazame TaxID=75743 RepID=A0A401P9U3_SCYTO|nr:hypothetical protein [Scyliorhinus torazame]
MKWQDGLANISKMVVPSSIELPDSTLLDGIPEFNIEDDYLCDDDAEVTDDDDEEPDNDILPETQSEQSGFG